MIEKTKKQNYLSSLVLEKIKNDNCDFISNFYSLENKKITEQLNSIKNLIVANEVFLIISDLKVEELVHNSKKTKGLFILTNKRIIFVNKVLFGKKVNIIKLEEIEHIDLIRRKEKAILKVLTKNTAYNFANLKNKHKDKIYHKILNLITK